MTDSNERTCPYCDEIIRPGARKCKHCGEWLAEGEVRLGGTGIERTGGDVVSDPTSMVRRALGKRYEIIGEIGRGGMATVYRAVQKNLEREVALKVLPGQLTYDEEFTERFHREARNAAALNHPHIITIYDEGEEGGVHYIAMEYITGADLRQRIKKKGALSMEELLRLLVPVAEGLAYAHEKGMVHRDIKSANILIGEGDRPVLTDFGIARAAETTKLTQTGTVIGTPEYMSPEQARGDGLDRRSDVYSLGVVLYEAASGVLPFQADTPLGLIHKITTEEAPGVESVADGLEPWLAEVIRRCLEKDPERRYQSCRELAEALTSGDPKATPVAETVHVASRPPKAPAANTAPREPAVQPSPEPPPAFAAAVKERKKRRVVQLILGLLAVAVVGWLGGQLLGGGGGSADTAATGGGKTATLSITSEPTGAVVYLDDAEIGSTPVEVETGAGGYRIRIEAEGYETVERGIAIAAGERQELSWTLTAEPPPRSMTNSVGMTFVHIEGGSFEMGSGKRSDERPVHRVTLSSFEMATTEVTQGQWERVMGSNPSDSDRGTGENNPVNGVSWYDALVFANRLSMTEGLTPVYRISGSTDPARWGSVPTDDNSTWNGVQMDRKAEGYRLPTEAEWEYAARGGQQSRGYTYAGSDSADDVAWYRGNSSDRSRPVAGKQANELGLYDMSGNVWEWCWDRYESYPSSAETDPLGPSSGMFRIIRGGSWNTGEAFTRSARRLFNMPYFRFHNYPFHGYGSNGFRLVRAGVR